MENHGKNSIVIEFRPKLKQINFPVTKIRSMFLQIANK